MCKSTARTAVSTVMEYRMVALLLGTAQQRCTSHWLLQVLLFVTDLEKTIRTTTQTMHKIITKYITGLLDMRPKCLCTSHPKTQQSSQSPQWECRISHNHHAWPRSSVYYLKWCPCKNRRKWRNTVRVMPLHFWYELIPFNHTTKHRYLFK